MKFRIIYIVVLFSIDFLQSAEIFVPQDFDSIQEAIDFSESGDVVFVSPGVYFESIEIDEKYINLISTHGPHYTTINGEGTDSKLINVINCPDFYTQVGGFTLLNDFTGDEHAITHIPYTSIIAGSIIDVNYSKVKLTNLIFTEGVNHSLVENNLIFINGSDVVLDRVLYQNSNDGFLVAYASQVKIENTIIKNIELGFNEYILSISNSDINIDRSIVKNTVSTAFSQIVVGNSNNENMTVNFNDLILVENSSVYSLISLQGMLSADIINSTIFNNICTGFEIFHTGLIEVNSGELVMDNSIVLNDIQDEFNFYDFRIENSNQISFYYSLIDSNSVNGHNNNCTDCIENNEMIMFVDPNLNQNYMLSENSPCIDAGNPIYTDDDGSVSDVGAFYYSVIGNGNYDGIVNVSDIIILVNLILSNKIPNYIELYVYSSIDDSLLDILDIIHLVNIVLGRTEI